MYCITKYSMSVANNFRGNVKKEEEKNDLIRTAIFSYNELSHDNL